MGLLVFLQCVSWVDRVLGPEIHSPQLLPIIVKVSRIPHVVSRSPFSFTLCLLIYDSF